jgi:hypothetical protein
MGGIEHALHGRMPVTLLAARDIALGKFEIIQDPIGVGPFLEQVVVLEEMVMAVSRMGDHEGLHRRRVLLHDIGDARVRVDDDLVG